MGIHNDPDLHHLRNLIALLPSPDNHGWWSAFAPRHRGYAEKIRIVGESVADPDPVTLAYACRYLLLFFSDLNEEMWQHMNVAELGLDLGGHAPPGRYLAEDICRTAWALYVRYNDNRAGWQRWGFPDDGSRP